MNKLFTLLAILSTFLVLPSKANYGRSYCDQDNGASQVNSLDPRGPACKAAVSSTTAACKKSDIAAENVAAGTLGTYGAGQGQRFKTQEGVAGKTAALSKEAENVALSCKAQAAQAAQACAGVQGGQKAQSYAKMIEKKCQDDYLASRNNTDNLNRTEDAANQLAGQPPQMPQSSPSNQGNPPSSPPPANQPPPANNTQLADNKNDNKKEEDKPKPNIQNDPDGFLAMNGLTRDEKKDQADSAFSLAGVMIDEKAFREDVGATLDEALGRALASDASNSVAASSNNAGSDLSAGSSSLEGSAQGHIAQKEDSSEDIARGTGGGAFNSGGSFFNPTIDSGYLDLTTGPGMDMGRVDSEDTAPVRRVRVISRGVVSKGGNNSASKDNEGVYKGSLLLPERSNSPKASLATMGTPEEEPSSSSSRGFSLAAILLGVSGFAFRRFI